MKRITFLMVAFYLSIAALFTLTATAQTVNCNGATGNVAIPSTVLSVTCPTGGTPPPPPPPTGCSASQVSTALGGKTFQRQCAGSMTAWPVGTNYYGPLTDLGIVFGNKSFPNYSYLGQSPTFQIDSGYYISLAFTPAASGLIKFTANNSYGDGGTISLSTAPGGLTPGAPSVICAMVYGGLNSILVSTTTGSCRVTIGQTYYINFADTNANGDQLCFGGTAGNCPQSRVSYAFTARAQ